MTDDTRVEQDDDEYEYVPPEDRLDGVEQPISRAELLEALDSLKRTPTHQDRERQHLQADILLLRFINDSEITEAFRRIQRWYS